MKRSRPCTVCAAHTSSSVSLIVSLSPHPAARVLCGLSQLCRWGLALIPLSSQASVSVFFCLSSLPSLYLRGRVCSVKVSLYTIQVWCVCVVYVHMCLSCTCLCVQSLTVARGQYWMFPSTPPCFINWLYVFACVSMGVRVPGHISAGQGTASGVSSVFIQWIPAVRLKSSGLYNK